MAALLEVVGNDMKVVGATSENAMHCTSKGRFTARSELLKVLFLVLSVCGFFVSVSNIPETAERICAKFTRKTCLIPRSDELEGQGQKSKVKFTRDKNGILALSVACFRFMFGKTSLASSYGRLA